MKCSPRITTMVMDISITKGLEALPLRLPSQIISCTLMGISSIVQL